jgi:integrase
LKESFFTRSPFVFVSERGTLFSVRGFQSMVERAARAAGFDMKIHPHMLRHSCGYAFSFSVYGVRVGLYAGFRIGPAGEICFCFSMRLAGQCGQSARAAIALFAI